jgi:hypothetical protein
MPLEAICHLPHGGYWSMRRRGRGTLAIRVAAPSKGLITRLPENIADKEKRGLLKAINVRCEDGVLCNAPGYRSLPTSIPLDSPVNLIFQANIKSQLTAVDERSPVVCTAGKVFAVSRREQIDETPPNVPPVVDAGPDLEQWQGRSLPVNGSASDPDEGPEALQVWWEQVSGPGILTFSNVLSAVTSVSASVAGVYVARLNAFDGLATSHGEVQLTFHQNVPPVVDAGPDQNNLAAAIIALNGSANDPDNGPDELTYEWSVVSGPDGLLISNPHDLHTQVQVSRVGVYVLRLTASDGISTVYDEVQLTWNFRLGTFDAAVIGGVLDDGMGGLICAGNFSNYTKNGNSTAVYRICRLDFLGNVDLQFKNNCKLSNYSSTYQILKQGNKYLVALTYSAKWDGTTLNRSLIRLNANGTLDESFVTDYKDDGLSAAYGNFSGALVLNSGKILIGADKLISSPGIGQQLLYCLQPDGAVDTAFQAGVATLGSAPPYLSGAVMPLRELASGKILLRIVNLSGYQGISTVGYNGIIRVHSTGLMDDQYQMGQLPSAYSITALTLSAFTSLADGRVFYQYLYNTASSPTTQNIAYTDGQGVLHVTTSSSGSPAWLWGSNFAPEGLVVGNWIYVLTSKGLFRFDVTNNFEFDAVFYSTIGYRFVLAISGGYQIYECMTDWGDKGLIIWGEFNIDGVRRRILQLDQNLNPVI